MHTIGGKQEALLPDLSGLPLNDVVEGVLDDDPGESAGALLNAVRRVLAEASGTEPTLSAYDSGTQLLPPGTSDHARP
jgi:hypothetical protein